MELETTDDERLLRDTCRAWFTTELAAAVPAMEAGTQLPYDLMRTMHRDLGLDAMLAGSGGRSGKSDGERYYIESFSEYQSDLDLVVKLARSREPGLPLFVLGHSAGGVIACNYVLDHQPEIAGLICESFAYRVPAPDFALAVLKGLSHLAPHAHVLNLPKKEFSRDPKVTQALIDDPLLADEVQPTRTVAEMVRADERLKRDFPLFKLPLLIIHGTRDTVTRPEGSQEFHDRAGSADKTLKLYDGYFHDPLNDIGKEAVMADIRAWLEKRIPA